MSEAELQEKLRLETARWASLSHRELSKTAFPVAYDTGASTDPEFFQTEVTLVERTAEYLHLVIAVSDVGLRSFRPLTEDLLVHADTGDGAKADT